MDFMSAIDWVKLGSVLLMLLFISVLIIAHELGHFFVARKCGIKVERFGFGLPFGPTLWSKKIGDVEYCLHAALFGGYVAFPDDNPDNPLPEDSPERFENQPLGNRFAVMVAGVAVNAVLGWVIMSGVIIGWGFPSVDVVIGQTFTGSPAVASGLQSGDVIKEVNGAPVQGYYDIDRISYVKDTIHSNAGKPITLTVLRARQQQALAPIDKAVLEDKDTANDPKLTLNVQKNIPTKHVQVNVVPDEKGTIGIQLAFIERYIPVANPAEAVGLSAGYLGNVVKMQFAAFGQMFAGKMGLNELSGPISIVNVGSHIIQKDGIQKGLMLTAIISMILAVMNLLPIPALDGGHILFLVIEALKGSPVKQEVRERFTQYGFLGLLGLIVFILFNDINNTFINPINLPK